MAVLITLIFKLKFSIINFHFSLNHYYFNCLIFKSQILQFYLDNFKLIYFIH